MEKQSRDNLEVSEESGGQVSSGVQGQTPAYLVWGISRSEIKALCILHTLSFEVKQLRLHSWKIKFKVTFGLPA